MASDENSNVVLSDPASQELITTKSDPPAQIEDSQPPALGDSQPLTQVEDSQPSAQVEDSNLSAQVEDAQPPAEVEDSQARDEGGDDVDSGASRDEDSTDEGSDWEAPVEVELTDTAPAQEQVRRQGGSWKSLRALTKWVPLSRKKYPWTQMAGHQGSFLAGTTGTILKLLVPMENENLQTLMHEPELCRHVPKYHGAVDKDGVGYVQLQDLLCEFTSPCVMDIKIGVRSYQEEELEKARKKPTLRKDMYQKMVSVDPDAPTSEEREQEAVIKPRYMRFRDDMSSTTSLGFRIEGIKTNAGSSKDFKDTRSRESVSEALKGFVRETPTVLDKYTQALTDIVKAQESSNFFKTNEIIGSSLLFIHDRSSKAGVWMIDFAKCTPLPDGVTTDHRSQWVEGNYEDGHLFGVDNLISIFKDLQQEFSQTAP